MTGDDLLFTEAPETSVALFGSPGHSGRSGSEREGLPDRVAPGEVYRHVRVDYALRNTVREETPEEGKQSSQADPGRRRSRPPRKGGPPQAHSCEA